ncbi:MAG: hypothetical protein M3619_18910 [Myxococcota bacterium]|nr:hypothetical protein [Myxococcota bacterium]
MLPLTVHSSPLASVNERAANTPTPSMIWKRTPFARPAPGGLISVFMTRMLPSSVSNLILSIVRSAVTSTSSAGVTPFDGANCRQCGVVPPQPFAQVTRSPQPTRSSPSQVLLGHASGPPSVTPPPDFSQVFDAEHTRPSGHSRVVVQGAPGVGIGL